MQVLCAPCELDRKTRLISPILGLKMKVTVTFGRTGVVVPCKEGWTVRDLIHQATQRYRKLLEQVRGHFSLRMHRFHLVSHPRYDPHIKRYLMLPASH